MGIKVQRLYFSDNMDSDKQMTCENKAQYTYKKCLFDIYFNPYRFVPIPREVISMPIVPELYCIQELHDTYVGCMKGNSGSVDTK
jgi:hypothetical protein